MELIRSLVVPTRHLSPGAFTIMITEKDTELVLIHSDNARHAKAKGNGAVQMKIRHITGN